MAPTVVFLHGFTHTGRSWHPVIAALGERYTSVADDIRGHGDASERVPGVAGGGDRRCRWRLRRGGSRSSGTRWAGGSRCMWRWRARRSGAAPRPDRGEPGDRRRGGALGARRGPTRRSPRRSSARRIEEFARRWAQTPVLAGLPAAARGRRPRRPLALDASRARASAAQAGHRARCRRCGIRLGELSMPVDPGGRRARREVPRRSLRRWRLRSRRRDGVVIARSTGHAVHLEAPDAVVRQLARFQHS